MSSEHSTVLENYKHLSDWIKILVSFYVKYRDAVVPAAVPHSINLAIFPRFLSNCLNSLCFQLSTKTWKVFEVPTLYILARVFTQYPIHNITGLNLPRNHFITKHNAS